MTAGADANVEIRAAIAGLESPTEPRRDRRRSRESARPAVSLGACARRRGHAALGGRPTATDERVEHFWTCKF